MRGYPHASKADHSQSFILHLVTGDSAQTVISRTASDFLGLGQSSAILGHVNIAGVHGLTKKCPLYEIKYTIDTVNLLKPGITYQRTAKMAVVESDRQPCTEGYYDLLPCVEPSLCLTVSLLHSFNHAARLELHTVTASLQEEPGRGGTESDVRYEAYKSATTVQPARVHLTVQVSVLRAGQEIARLLRWRKVNHQCTLCRSETPEYDPCQR